jgi:hypothetical protein
MARTDASQPADGGIRRREVLAGVALVPASLTLPRGFADAATPQTLHVGDAHSHLFNAADLPVKNFLKYVELPSRYSSPPRWAKALVDLFGTVFKSLASTANDELGHLGRDAAVSDVSPERFGELVSKHASERMAVAKGGLVGPDALELAASYRELNEAVAADAGDATGFVDVEQPNATLLTLLARKVDAGPVGPGDVADRGRSAAMSLSSLSDAARILGWGYQMLQSRERHIRRYLEHFKASGAAPDLLVNHLVDYDMWLDDGPAAGSDLLAQVAVMTRLASARRDRAVLKLFAGFCPLKHAIETAQRPSTTLDALIAARRAGKVHGFKLYPPMGFRPIGNAELGDGAFDPAEAGRRTALDKWRAVGKGSLGQALDASLSGFYAMCAAERAPIMAHAARSNAAGPGYADRANPLYWAKVVERYPLRLSLGHLVDEVGPFVTAAEKGPPYPADVWSLYTSTTLLDPRNGRGEVYGDLAYTQELIDERKLTERFFRCVLKAFGPRDPELTRVLYGTDWIMLGLERHNDRYLEFIMRGMRDAGLTSTQQNNILVNNVRRFLRP